MFSACIVAALTGFCGAFWAVHSGIENWFGEWASRALWLVLSWVGYV